MSRELRQLELNIAPQRQCPVWVTVNGKEVKARFFKVKWGRLCFITNNYVEVKGCNWRKRL